MVDTLTQYVHRWKVMYLHLPGQLLSYFCYGRPALQCALESLSVDLFDYDDITEFRTEDFGRLTRASPKRIRLLDPKFWDVDELHWSNVTFLKLSEFGCAERRTLKNFNSQNCPVLHSY